MLVPSLILKQLYTFGSLENTAEGVCFTIKNRLSDAQLTEVMSIRLSGQEVPLDQVQLDFGNNTILAAQAIKAEGPIDFPLRKEFIVRCTIAPLPKGKHAIEVKFRAKPFGKLTLKVDGSISDKTTETARIPRGKEDDYDPEIIKIRQDFIETYTGKKLNHIRQYSFDPHITDGNCEHFSGVAQIPMGFAGPLRINGEHAQGDFLIPMATTEGTLVASYNRGIKITQSFRRSHLHGTR